MSVYRVDYLNGKFYIGKIGHHDLKKRMREHRCVKGCGLATWYPDEDITTTTIREIGRPAENETIAECEDRLIREVLGDANCLNKNRGHRTLDEVKQQKKESYISYMEEHPEKKAEYDASYRQRHLDEMRKKDKTYYEQNREKVLDRQTEYYHTHKLEIAARDKAKRDAMTPEEKQKKLDAMKEYRDKKKAEKLAIESRKN